jgi:hypothetical protein
MTWRHQLLIDAYMIDLKVTCRERVQGVISGSERAQATSKEDPVRLLYSPGH